MEVDKHIQENNHDNIKLRYYTARKMFVWHWLLEPQHAYECIVMKPKQCFSTLISMITFCLSKFKIIVSFDALTHSKQLKTHMKKTPWQP